MRGLRHGIATLTCVLLLLLSAACAGNGGVDVSDPAITIVEPRLSEPLVETFPPADARPFDGVKKAVFERINRDRAAEGLPTVLWDDAASRVADDFCSSQIREDTVGHFLTDGIPPYARTAFAGIFGMQLENAVTWKTNAPFFEDPIATLALEGHDGMLAEKPPNDGHRRTILDPDVTHVGVGWALSRGEFRMAQEFLVRQLAWLRLERLRSNPGVLHVSGAPIEGRRLRFVTIAWEPPPRRLTRQQASSVTSYSYPRATLAFVGEGNATLKVRDTVTNDRIQFGLDRNFSFRFSADRPGLWTFLFYTARRSGERVSQSGMASVWFDQPGAAVEPAGSP